jgi:hypothetical protein
MITRTTGSGPDDQKSSAKTSLVGKFAPHPAPTREFGFPSRIEEPIYLFRDDGDLKAHPRYSEAKRGSTDAAIELVHDLAVPLLNRVYELMVQGFISEDVIFLAPHAREASGDNAIPQVLSALLSVGGGELDRDIVQTSKVYHRPGPNGTAELSPFFSWASQARPRLRACR